MSLDLIVLVPDKDVEQAVDGILARHQSLRIRPGTSHRIVVHPNRDPGIYNTGHELLESFVGEARNALVVFDRAWDGAPAHDPVELAEHVAKKCRHDWGDRARCVCIDPEIENWVWSDSPNIAAPLGWATRDELVEWLRARGLWPDGMPKPPDPKRAFEAATRHKQVVPSSAIFRKLAATVAIHRCHDPSFLAPCNILRSWFPLESSGEAG